MVIFMNWIDIMVIIILIFSMINGFRLGLIVSIFSILKIIISVIITKQYYPLIYEYIINKPKIYNIFNTIVEFILNILFYTKNKQEPKFIPDLISKGLVKIIITFFAIGLVFWLSNKLLNLIIELFSHIFKVPVLKQLNKVGGILFGLVKGLFIIYLLNLILYPIAFIFPKSFIGKAISDSFVFNYLKEQIFIIFSNKVYI